MPRLPKPGGDYGIWGQVLNQYLLVTQESDGTSRGYLNVKELGALGNAEVNPLKNFFKTLDEAKAVYPRAQSLDDTIDWAAIQKAIDLAIDPTGQTIAARDYRRANQKVLIPGGVYQLNRPLEILSVEGFSLTGAGPNITILRAQTALETFLDINGVNYALIENLTLETQGPNGRAKTMVAVDYTPTRVGAKSCRANTFRSIRVTNGVFETGFKVGAARAANDQAVQGYGTAYYDCGVYGSFRTLEGAGTSRYGKPIVKHREPTLYRHGWLLDAGDPAKSLDHYFYNSAHVHLKYGTYADCCAIYVFAQQPAGAETDYYLGSRGTGAYLSGLRMEISERFFESAASPTPATVCIADCYWTAQTLDDDGEWIRHRRPGSLIIDGVSLQYVPRGKNASGQEEVLPAKIKVDAPGPVAVMVRGLSTPLPLDQVFALSANASLVVKGYIEMEEPVGIIKGQTLFYSNRPLNAPSG